MKKIRRSLCVIMAAAMTLGVVTVKTEPAFAELGSVQVTTNGVTTQYDTISEAWAAAKTTEYPSYIKLNQDCATTGRDETYTVLSALKAGMNVTLDLNGHMLSGNVSDAKYCKFIDVTAGAVLTITDTSEEQTGLLIKNSGANTSNAGAMIRVTGSGSTLNITGGKIQSNYTFGNACTLFATSSGKINVSGGKIYYGGTSVAKPYLLASSNGTITATGGEFSFNPADYSVTIPAGYKAAEGTGTWTVRELMTFEIRYYDGAEQYTSLAEDVTEDESCILAPAQEKEGYAFTGWNTRADGEGTKYNAEQEVVFTESINLYAQWVEASVETHDIYYFNGEEALTDLTNANIAEGATAETAAAITKPDTASKCYTFREWNTSPDGLGTGYAAGAVIVMGEADINLYAVFDEEDTAAQVTVNNDTNYYTDFAEAWTAAVGNVSAEVVLLDDALVTSILPSFTKKASAITLDLNGNTLYVTNSALIRVIGGTLTIRNGNIIATGDGISSWSGVNYSNGLIWTAYDSTLSYGNITLDGVTIDVSDYVVSGKNTNGIYSYGSTNSKLILTDTELITAANSTYRSIYIYRGQLNISDGDKIMGNIVRGEVANTTFNIFGGKFEKDPTALLPDGYNVIETADPVYAYKVISGEAVATVTCGNDTEAYSSIDEAFAAAVEASTDSTGLNAGSQGTDVTVTLLADANTSTKTLRKGSSASYDTVTRTFTLDLNGFNYRCNSGASEPAFLINNGTTLRITGGGIMVAGYLCNGNNGSSYILEDGYYNAVTGIKSSSNTSVTIEGGKFNADPSAYLASGVYAKSISETNGKYTFLYEVAEGTAQASVDGRNYASVTEAVAEANGADIVLLRDLNMPVQIGAGEKVSFVTNGFTVADGVIESEGIVYINGVITNSGSVNQISSAAKVVSASLYVARDLTFNYTVLVSPATAQTAEEILLTSSVGFPGDAVALDGPGVYEFTNTVTAAQMGNVFSIGVMLGEETVDGFFEYSVRDYVIDLYNAYPEDEKLNALTANMLAYGTEVQKFWEGNGEAFEMPEQLGAFVTYRTPTASDNKKGTVTAPVNAASDRIFSASINISDKVCIYFNVMSHKGNILEVSVNGETVQSTVLATDSSELIYMSRINPTQFGQEYIATLYGANHEALHSVSYSVYSYFYSKINDDEVGSLCLAGYNYGKAAEQYVFNYNFGEAIYTWNDSYTACEARVVYDDGTPDTVLQGTVTRTVTQERSGMTPELCTYTATFESELFETQVVEGVRTRVTGIETNINAETVYVPTLRLSSIIKYRPVYTGGTVGDWKDFIEEDFSNVSYNAYTKRISADIDVTVSNVHAELEIDIPMSQFTDVADALALPENTGCVIRGLVVSTHSSQSRQEIVLFDPDSGADVNVVFYIADASLLNGFSVGDEVALPVVIGSGAAWYSGDAVWTNYKLSTGNDTSGYTASPSFASLLSVEISSMPAKTVYDHRVSSSELNLRGGKLRLTYSDGSSYETELTADMLTAASGGMGEMNYTVSYDGKSTNLALSYEYVSVSEFKTKQASSKPYELRGVIIGAGTLVAGEPTSANGEIFLKDTVTSDVVGLKGLDITTSDPYRGMAVGDEILVQVTRSTSGSGSGTSEANKLLAAVIGTGNIETLSRGNSVVLDKEGAVSISTQAELQAFLADADVRGENAYKLVKFAPGLHFARYSETSDNNYIFYEGNTFAAIKVDGIYPFIVSYSQMIGLGDLLKNVLFNGETASVGNGGVICDKELYMLYYGGRGVYYHQFTILNAQDYIGDEVSLVRYDYTAPSKTTYLLGEELNLAGGKVEKVMSAPAYNQTFALTTAMVTGGGYDKDTAGDYTVEITVDGQQFLYPVTVSDLQVESVTLKSAPDISAFGHRETLDTIDLTGAVLEASYTNGSSGDVPITRDMLPEDSAMAIGTHDYTVTYGGAVTALSLTREYRTISVSEFKAAASGEYEVEAVVVGVASSQSAIELLIKDTVTEDVIGVYNTGIAGSTGAPAINTDYCTAGDRIIVTLTRATLTGAGVNQGKVYANGPKFKESLIVLSHGNNYIPDVAQATVTSVQTQDELRNFLLSDTDRFYKIVRLCNLSAVNSGGSLRFFFGDEIASIEDQYVNYSNTTTCSPLLGNANSTAFLGSGWLTSYFNNTASTDYSDPVTAKQNTVYALYLGGNASYEMFAILSSGWFTSEEHAAGVQQVAAAKVANVHTAAQTIPEKHLILTPDGDYGGTANLSRYGEGAPLNGELDHLDSEWYTFNDFYNLASVAGQRTMLPHFASYQQTMADSDGIACALMVFNYFGEDVMGDYSEEALVADYEDINGVTLYGTGCTAEGLVELFADKGYEAESVSYSNEESWIKANIEAGNIILFRFHNIEKTYWVAVVGYDNMGTLNTAGDDIIILACPFDVGDHFQDGYIKAVRNKTLTWAKDIDLAGNSSRTGECVVVKAKSAVTLEYSETDEMNTDHSIYERHLLYNIDGTFSGPYKVEDYGRRPNWNGYIFMNDSYLGTENYEHLEANYYAHPDVYNMSTNSSGRYVLGGFDVFQQTMVSSCGISSTLNTLNYLGYDFTDLLNHFDSSDFGELLPEDSSKVQEAIVRVYMLGDSYFDDPSHKFNNYGGVGAGNLVKVPLAIGYEGSVMGRYYRSTFTSAEASMPFPTYESFAEFVKENISHGQPIIFCGPGHWRVIIGIDDMGTESKYDDVIITADSSDNFDHYQDGYNTEYGVEFYAHWYNKSGSTNQQYILIKEAY